MVNKALSKWNFLLYLKSKKGIAEFPFEIGHKTEIKFRINHMEGVEQEIILPNFKFIIRYYLWKIKLLYLFLHLLMQTWSQNHNCNDLNVFLIVLSHNNARSENGQSILWRHT